MDHKIDLLRGSAKISVGRKRTTDYVNVQQIDKR